MWVCFRYILCSRDPSVFLYMSISRNGMWPSSISIVNCIFLCSPLRWFRNSVKFSCPWGQMTKASFTYLYQCAALCVACYIAFFSNFSMKKFAMTGESGESFPIPSVCS